MATDETLRETILPVSVGPRQVVMVKMIRIRRLVALLHPFAQILANLLGVAEGQAQV